MSYFITGDHECTPEEVAQKSQPVNFNNQQTQQRDSSTTNLSPAVQSHSSHQHHNSQRPPEDQDTNSTNNKQVKQKQETNNNNTVTSAVPASSTTLTTTTPTFPIQTEHHSGSFFSRSSANPAPSLATGAVAVVATATVPSTAITVTTTPVTNSITTASTVSSHLSGSSGVGGGSKKGHKKGSISGGSFFRRRRHSLSDVWQTTLNITTAMSTAATPQLQAEVNALNAQSTGATTTTGAATAASLNGTTPGAGGTVGDQKAAGSVVGGVAVPAAPKRPVRRGGKPQPDRPQRALFCLGLKNPIRKLCIDIVEWK